MHGKVIGGVNVCICKYNTQPANCF